MNRIAIAIEESHDRECNGRCGWSSTYCESQWREFFRSVGGGSTRPGSQVAGVKCQLGSTRAVSRQRKINDLGR
ncbi:hypothetical protein SEA_JUICE456_43 [Mycobacterium phage Juice456]|nr:hypothetical protein SEA_JUICE456_43 [Mycobacterium phage Juice456]